MARKQRQFSAQFKFETVMEVLLGRSQRRRDAENGTSRTLWCTSGSRIFWRKPQGCSRTSRADSGVGATGGTADDGKCVTEKRGELAGSSAAEKRAVIGRLRGEAPLSQLREVFGCVRSTYYYQPVEHNEHELLVAIEAMLMRQPWFGYRRVVAQLRRDGWTVGERVARRLLKQLQHSQAVGRVRVQTTGRNHSCTRYRNLIRGVRVTRSNQLWVADIT